MKKTVEQISQERYGIANPSPELRRSIEAMHKGEIVDKSLNFNHGNFVSALDRPPGMSVQEHYERQERARNSVEWNERQRREMERESADPEMVAAEARIELAERRVRAARGSINEVEAAKRTLAEAVTERDELVQQRADEQRAAEHQALVTSNPNFQRALENAQATVRLLASRGDDDEYISALSRLKILQNSTPESLDGDLKSYWLGESKFSEREALKAQEKESDLLKQAADATAAVADQKAETLGHQANAADARAEIESVDESEAEA